MNFPIALSYWINQNLSDCCKHAIFNNANFSPDNLNGEHLSSSIGKEKLLGKN